MGWKECWTTDDIQKITQVRTADGVEWTLFEEGEGWFIATRLTPPSTAARWKHNSGKSWLCESLGAVLAPVVYPVDDHGVDYVEVAAVLVKD